VLNSDS